MTDCPQVIAVTVPAEPAVVQARVQGDIQTVQVRIPGEQGPPGSGGGGGTGGGVEFLQAAAAATWTFSHGFGRRPSVSVYDTAGEELIADVFASASNVSIVFAQPTAGSVVLS